MLLVQVCAVLDEGGQGGGFPGACFAANQNQALVQFINRFYQAGRNHQFLQSGNRGAERSQRHFDGLALGVVIKYPEKIVAKPLGSASFRPGHGNGAINLAGWMLGDIRQKPLDFGVAHAVDEFDEDFLTGRNSGCLLYTSRCV